MVLKCSVVGCSTVRNVCTYMSGYIHRKLESKHDCVYCEEYLKNSETKTCDLIEKKNLGGLVKPH